eukprot:590951-Amphidinium_carterae.1
MALEICPQRHLQALLQCMTARSRVDEHCSQMGPDPLYPGLSSGLNSSRQMAISISATSRCTEETCERGSGCKINVMP